MISARDLREFRGFLRNATDRQVQGIYDKESSAGRDEYAELAVAEAERRGIHLEQTDHASKKRGHATTKTVKKDRLFIGTFPTGIGYADKQRERDGDYMRVAFLPFSTLELEWAPGTHPPDLRKSIEQHAARIAERRGQEFQVSTSGQTVTLGRHHATKKSHAQLDREIAQVLERKSGPSRTGASPGRHHSSISDSDKIRDAIARFPSTFGLRGFPGNVFRISPTSSYVSGGRVMLYTERKDDGGWSDFSKGTESELRSEITSLSSTRK